MMVSTRRSGQKPREREAELSHRVPSMSNLNGGRADVPPRNSLGAKGQATGPTTTGYGATTFTGVTNIGASGASVARGTKQPGQELEVLGGMNPMWILKDLTPKLSI